MKREFLGFLISSIRILYVRLYSLRFVQMKKEDLTITKMTVYFFHFPPNHIIFITVCASIATRNVLFLRFRWLEARGSLVNTRKLCSFSKLFVHISRCASSFSIFFCRICYKIYFDENSTTVYSEETKLVGEQKEAMTLTDFVYHLSNRFCREIYLFLSSPLEEYIFAYQNKKV